MNTVTFTLAIHQDDEGWFVRATSTAGHLLESNPRLETIDEAETQLWKMANWATDTSQESFDRLQRFANGEVDL